MATNKKIQTTELDFDGIKQSLKQYLQGQSEFSDYDFEGSGLSTLLDILAYNTHYNALYTNLAINEAFLDSASKRSSVVSKAKELGYVPHSAASATAIVDIVMINNQTTAPPFIEIPRNSTFSTRINDVQYTFYNTQTQIAQRINNQYLFSNVELKEGTLLEYRYNVDVGSKFVIPNIDVDLSTLRVSVAENALSSTSSTFVRSTTVIDVGPNDKVYFTKELDNGLYEVEFGDGTIGAALDLGNVVTLSYIVCSRDAPNGASTFTYTGALPANTEAYVTTIQEAVSGAGPEAIESIRWNAPRFYAAQNRCVTADDYKAIIMSNFPNVKAINVWGGETATPPVYGKVYISIVPDTETVLTSAEKQFIINDILAPRKSLTVTPEIVDPTYVRIGINTAFYYNPQLTTISANDIQSLVRQTIEDYNDTTLNTFGSVFKYSRLSTLIDQTEPSITSNITTIKVYRDVTPIFNTSTGYTVNLGNPIYYSGVPEESILSNGLYVTDSVELCYIEDIQTLTSRIGTLRLFYYNVSGEKVFVKNIGTVDYSKGIIQLNELTITGLAEEKFTFVIKPQSNDVASTEYQFVTIDPTLTTITAVADVGNQPYTFTPSRN